MNRGAAKADSVPDARTIEPVREAYPKPVWSVVALILGTVPARRVQKGSKSMARAERMQSQLLDYDYFLQLQ